MQTSAPSIAARLDAYLLRAAERGPFDWAANNCCQFAARWVAEVEGRDPMAELSATPDARSAWALIASYGGIAEAISQQLGRAPVAPAFAQVGDIVVYQLPNMRHSVGICNGLHSLLVDEHGASLMVPTVQCLHAWRVGA